MIISKLHKYFYVRVPKTGSTSVTRFLLENLPLEDAIVHTGCEEVDDLPAISPKNFYLSGNEHIDKIYVRRDHDDIISPATLVNANPHTLPRRITKLQNLSHVNLNDYYQFAVCRDPIERFKSRVMHYINDSTHYLDLTIKKQKDFKEYLIYSDYIFNGLEPQSDWLKLENKLLKNIYCYENIYSLVEHISSFYNIQPTKFNNYNLRKSRISLDLPASVVTKIKNYYQEDFEIRNKLIHDSK